MAGDSIDFTVKVENGDYYPNAIASSAAYCGYPGYQYFMAVSTDKNGRSCDQLNAYPWLQIVGEQPVNLFDYTSTVSGFVPASSLVGQNIISGSTTGTVMVNVGNLNYNKFPPNGTYYFKFCARRTTNGDDLAYQAFTVTAPIFQKLSTTKSGTGKGYIESTDDKIINDCSFDSLCYGASICACPGTKTSNTFLKNKSVTLRATPVAGSAFSGWSGACSGTNSTCTVMMNADKSVTATFTAANYLLTVNKSGSGTGSVTSSPSGINCGSTCSANYTSGTSITLTATPNSGSTFSSWGGDCTVANNTCTFSLTSAKNITANFAIVQAIAPSVTTSAATNIFQTTATLNGSVTDPGSSALLKHGFYLSNNSDCSSGTEYQVSGTSTGAMTQNLSNLTSGKTYYFDAYAQNSNSSNAWKFGVCTTFITDSISNYTINASATAGGSISPGGSVSVGGGSSQGFSTQASADYHFSNFTVDGATISGQSSYTFSNVNANHTIVANFVSNPKLTINASPSDAGSVKSADGKINIAPSGYPYTQIYATGTSVSLTATAVSGKAFQSWTGCPSGSATDNPCVFSMPTSDLTITAVFGTGAPITKTLTVSKTGTGVGSISSDVPGISNCNTTNCKAAFNQNTSVTLTVTNTNSKFTGWGGDCLAAGTTTTCTLQMSTDKNATANFDSIIVPNTVSNKRIVKVIVSWQENGNTVSQEFKTFLQPLIAAPSVTTQNNLTVNCSNLPTGLGQTVAVSGNSTTNGGVNLNAKVTADQSCFNKVGFEYNDWANSTYCAQASYLNGNIWHDAVAAFDTTTGKDFSAKATPVCTGKTHSFRAYAIDKNNITYWSNDKADSTWNFSY